ncbi:hypothetical protein EJB05_20578, partial [Eragrostis curvula]
MHEDRLRFARYPQPLPLALACVESRDGRNARCPPIGDERRVLALDFRHGMGSCRVFAFGKTVTADGDDRVRFVVWLWRETGNHPTLEVLYQQKLSALIGEDQATQLVNQALVLITLGGNDFVNNYYLVPMSVRSRQISNCYCLAPPSSELSLCSCSCCRNLLMKSSALASTHSSAGAAATELVLLIFAAACFFFAAGSGRGDVESEMREAMEERRADMAMKASVWDAEAVGCVRREDGRVVRVRRVCCGLCMPYTP